jgi:hypothetical protein
VVLGILVALAMTPELVSSETITTSKCDTLLGSIHNGNPLRFSQYNQLAQWRVIGSGATAKRQCEWHLEYNEAMEKLNSACTLGNPCQLIPFTCDTLPEAPPDGTFVFCRGCNADATCSCGGPGAIAQWSGTSWSCDGLGQESTATTVYQICKLVRSVVPAEDSEPFWAGTSTGSRIKSVGCYCHGACTTPAQISIQADMNSISLDGGSNVTCSTSSPITFTDVDTGDTDRDLTSGELLRFSVDNVPSADDVLLCVRFTLQ